MSANNVIQFNWRRNWKKLVVPHLMNEQVQAALDAGMSAYDPSWKRGDAPWEYGKSTLSPDGVEGKLSWYQPAGRCHYIAPFSCVIGAIIYPELSWSILTNNRHSVAVGYWPNGEPKVVMDILNFSWMTAEQSIEFADPSIPDEQYFALLRQQLIEEDDFVELE